MTHAGNQQTLQHLGRESGLLIYNAFSGFDPDAFGAVSGTLAGGGLLLLLTPALDQWAKQSDPEAERITVANYNLPKPSRLFTRLASILETEPTVARITAAAIKPTQTDTLPDQTDSTTTDPSCCTNDQSAAVEAIIHVVKGHGKRPLVLSSDRGRGKSSALGIAAARLLQNGYKRILVTATRQAAVETLFAMAARELGMEQQGADTLHHQQGEIEYVAPDRLILEQPRGDLLLVDEAAAIPTPLLKKLLAHYPRITFATTVHGYEGTGLGFNHRFKKHLDQQRPQWREIQLKTPIRWALNDPLEQLVFRMLALDAEPAQIDHDLTLDNDQLSITFPSQTQLMEDEQQLQQFFGLLVLAHYRTTPRDLWHLLDGPNLQPVVVKHRKQIIAVALLASEGEFSAELAEQIWLGRRRPRGHLLAQSLSAHLGLRTASTLKGLRIMRIAVHPALQNRGLGQQLLNTIQNYASDQAYDYLGVSFGAETRLIRFWQANGMKAVRLGIHPGASSSQQSVMHIQALSSRGESMLKQARTSYARQLPALLAEPLSQVSTELLVLLLKGIETPPVSDLTEQEWLDAIAYAFGNRGYDYTQATIQTLALNALVDGLLDDSENSLLIKRVLQKQLWSDCTRALDLSGKKSADSKIRKTLQKVVSHYADSATTDLVCKIKRISD
ncbi:tRNA(Met) cytidine acetyltransferase TmcA [Candidatus Thiodiazotropha endoloripes]|uniref:tRNA(Met) cytidine acetyltransferase TmcA n=1 Tax=Candidatus Thiodiazotropha endoloripes TaxID=1818881 RepID=UPI002FF536EE